ncbi:phage tail tape measure protein [Gracilibacillus saliphilus]|uniref:phage tail tape measure protein n=1 Tax=Gracilibacillus saliphilus TaxID=543890 RepID=UPI0013D83267|nr:phage tail tape measure protein [Gracilibacillus saliphilus]
MAKEYSVVTKIKANITDFKSKMKTASDESNKLKDKIQSNMKKAGNGMKNIGKNTSKYVTAPLAAIGTVAFAAANDIDKAYSNIITGTGATGDALDGLKNDFDEVFKFVPNSADEVSNALATINTLTGATGESLQALTQNVLEASNSLGEDGVANSEAFGQALKQWQIPAEEGTDQLDHLFKLTQDYGVGLGEISGHLNTYGSVLQNAGFNMAESADLMANLESSGISVSRVMPGLNKSFRDWAKEGKNSKEELQSVITEMQNAESNTEALAIAQDVFGAEGAQRMTTAIRNGSIELDNSGASMDESKGAISENTEQTQTFGDKLAILKNKAQEGLQPLGDTLLTLAEEWLPKVVGAVEKVSNWFNNLSPTMQKVIPIIGMVVAAIPPLLVVIGSVVSAISTLAPLFTAVGAAIGAISAPVLIVVGVIAGLVAAGVALWKNWDTVKAKTIEIWESIKEFFVSIFEGIKTIFLTALDWIDQKTNGKFKAITDAIRQYINMAWENLEQVWSFIKDTFKNSLDFVKALVKGDFQGMKDAIRNQMNNISSTVSNIWNNISNFFGSVLGNIVSTVKNKFNSIKSSATTIFNAVKTAIMKPIDTAKEKVKTAIDEIKGFFSGMKLKFPKISMPKLPKFSLDGKFSFNPPSVPKIKVNWNAAGGIFNKPTIFNTANAGLQGVGEAGSEAIIPLKDSVLGKIGKMIAKTMDMDIIGSLQSLSNTFNPSTMLKSMENGISDAIQNSSNDTTTQNNNTTNELTVNLNIDNMNGTQKDVDSVINGAIKGFEKMGYKMK